MQELLELLRPGLKRFGSFEEACIAVDELQAAEAAVSANGSLASESSDSDTDAQSDSDKGRSHQKSRKAVPRPVKLNHTANAESQKAIPTY